MLAQLAPHTPLTIHATNEQDLNPRTCPVNDHPSVLVDEMLVIEPGENPTLMLTWKSTVFLIHIMSQTLDNALVVNLVSTLTVITFRRVRVNVQDYQSTNGSDKLILLPHSFGWKQG